MQLATEQHAHLSFRPLVGCAEHRHGCGSLGWQRLGAKVKALQMVQRLWMGALTGAVGRTRSRAAHFKLQRRLTAAHLQEA